MYQVRGDYMKIKVYGPGCANCQNLEKNTKEAVKEIGVDAEITKIQDMDHILEAGIIATPGLAIDGELKAMGRVPSVEEIKKWIKAKM
jgi:small redox-active disulfide protein 2